MKKFLMVLFLLLLCAVGFGFYRGWFALSSPSSNTESNNVNINLKVDPDKMKADATTVKEKTIELKSEVTQEAK